MHEIRYAIKSKFGYWNADKRNWSATIYGSTWYCSQPFADGQAEVLREKFGTKTWLATIKG